MVLFAHVRTGKWASVMPAKLAEVLGLTEKVRAIPIVEPEVTHSIGLVVPHRNPLTPLINALVREAKELAPLLERVRERRRSGRADQRAAHQSARAWLIAPAERGRAICSNAAVITEAFGSPVHDHGMTATPQGRRPTGTDFSALSDSTSITVRSLVSPLAT